jgi:hypothetical protein
MKKMWSFLLQDKLIKVNLILRTGQVREQIWYMLDLEHAVGVYICPKLAPELGWASIYMISFGSWSFSSLSIPA